MQVGNEPRSEPASLHRYRMIADNSSDVVYQTGIDGRIQWIQPTVEALLGWKPEDLHGVLASSLVHPDDLELINRLRVHVYDGDELDDIPCRFRTASGGYRNCSVRARPVRDENGTIVAAVMALRDSHEQAAVLRALTTLSQGNAVLVRAHEELALLQRMCDTIVDAGQYDFAWYGRKLDDEGRSIVPIARAGVNSDLLFEIEVSWGDGPKGDVPTGRAARTGTTQVTTDILKEITDPAIIKAVERRGFRSSISLPVRVGDEVDGVLVVAAAEANSFDDLARTLLEDLVADLGFGLERLRDVSALDASRLEAEHQRSQMKAILDSQLDPFVLLEAVRDENGRIRDLRYVEANAAAEVGLATTRDVLLASTMLELMPGLVDDPMPRYLAVVEQGVPVVLDDYAYPNELVGDEERRYDIRAVKTGDGIAMTWRDVTDRFKAVQEIAASERRYRILAENASDVVWELNADGEIAWISESITRVLGWLPEQVLGRTSLFLIHPDERERASANRDKVLNGAHVDAEFRLLRADGTFRWMALSAQAVTIDGQRIRVAALKDIDDEVAKRRELEHVIQHDPLTGLANRAAALQRIGRLQARASDDAESLTVMCIDVDGLSRINEAFTNAAGDQVLHALADRLIAAVGDPDLVARGVADEFIVTLLGKSSVADIAEQAAALCTAAHPPIDADGREVTPTVSIGVVLATDGRTPEAILRDAALAVRKAKDAGGDCFEFADPSMAQQAEDEMALEAAIRAALPRGEFVPWLQPVIDLRTGTLAGYEALVRWERADGTVVCPDDFLPIAEQAGLISAIDDAVLYGVIQLIPSLPTDVFVAVNVSATTLAQPGHGTRVVNLLKNNGIAAKRLHLEVTETSLLGSVETVRHEMMVTADAGVHWYVDDFGTGYSSISHLRDLPIAGLKLDKSFTALIAQGDSTSTRLAQALAGLAQGLQLDTVAEGIENQEVATIIAWQGWAHGQGYLYGRPTAPEQTPR